MDGDEWGGYNLITPVMFLLSGITKDFGYDHPVDIMYLNMSDRALILREVERLGKNVSDDDMTLTTTDVLGNEVVDTSQLCAGEIIDISLPTAVILTRLRQAYASYKNTAITSVETGSDLDTDTVLLRLEGNPKYVYTYVYEMMENRSLDYDDKIAKIFELYSSIMGYMENVGNNNNDFLVRRLEEQGSLAFWQRLITVDCVRRTGTIPSAVTEETISKTKEELNKLGYYGFVNPWKMYSEFVTSRINRKVELNINAEVIDYLETVVKSGGVVLS